MSDKRDRAITCQFCHDLHSPLLFSGLLQKDLFKKGEVWWKVTSTKLLSRLSQKVCRLLFSSILLRKLPIISVTLRVGSRSPGCHGYLPCCLAAPYF